MARRCQYRTAKGAVFLATVLATAATGTTAGEIQDGAGRTRTIRLILREGTNIAAAASPKRDAIVFHLQGMLWSMPFSGGSARQLTGFEMEATRPKWSHKGDAIAFQAYDGNYHVWVMRPDGSEARQLTFGPFDDREPAWSPDDRQIAFASDRGRDGSLDIWTVDVATGSLSRFTTSATEEYQPAWSTREEIAFIEDGKTIVALAKSGERRTLATVSSGRIEAPSWKPDGSGVAYIVVDGSTSRLVIDAKAVTDGQDVFTFPPCWISEREILYTADGGLRLLDLDGGASREIPFQAELTLERPTWAPVRRAFSSTKPNPVKGILHPRLSPDGQSVLFGALGDLYWMRIGQRPQRLTEDRYFEYTPEWSRDGRHILYTSDKAGTMDVYMREVGTGTEKQLTSGGGTEYAPALSPDGSLLAYLDDEDDLWLLDLGSGSRRKLIDDGREALGRPTWSPDGRFIAVGDLKRLNGRFREGYNQIRIVNVATGASRFEAPGPFESIAERGDSGPVWSPDGRWMAFILQSALWLMPVDPDGTPRGIARPVTRETADSPSWSGDSSHLLYIYQGGLKMVRRDGTGSRAIPLDLSWTNQMATGRTLIHAGSLWDGTSDAVRKNVDLVIEGDRIVEVRPHSDHPAGVETVDASHRTVLPGLFEAHNHPQAHFHRYGTRYWTAYLFMGITENVSMGGYLNEAISAREALASGRMLGPRLFATGETLDGSRVAHSPNRVIVSDEQLELELERHKALRPDYFKTYVRLPTRQMARIAEVAHELGVPAGSHYLWPGIQSGQDMTAHLSATSRDFSPTVSPTGRSYQDVYDLYSKAGFDLIQTTSGMPLLGNDPGLLSDPLIQALFPEREMARLKSWAGTPPAAVQLGRIRQDVAKYAKIIRARGNIATGTDAPGGVPPGISVQMAIRALVAGGLTPVEALRTATSTAAKVLGLDADLGTVAPGKLADLIFVEGDPLANIDDLMKVMEVMKAGILYRRAEIGSAGTATQ